MQIITLQDNTQWVRRNNIDSWCYSLDTYVEWILDTSIDFKSYVQGRSYVSLMNQIKEIKYN